MADIKQLHSAVDDDTVKTLTQALAAAKRGDISGVFIVVKNDAHAYSTCITESFRDFHGRGMLVSAFFEEFSAVVDSNRPLIGAPEDDDDEQ